MIQVKSKEIALCHISLYIHIYLPISFYLLINLSIHPSINFSYSFVPSFSSLLSHFVLSFFPYYFLFNIYCLYKNTVVSSNSYFLIVFSFILHLSLLQCLSFSLFLLSLFSLSFFSVPLTLYIYIPSCNALPKWFQKFIVVRYKVLGLDYRMNIKCLLPHHHLWSHKSTYISRNRCWLHEVHYIHMHTYISRNRCKHREIFTDIRYIHEYVHRYTCTHIYMCVNVYVCIHIPLREAEGEQRLCAGLGYLLSSS